MKTGEEDSELWSIGRAASVVGIAPATLRMWEKRYGRPVPVRLPSGHRRYTADQVRWLRRVSEALARGTRAAEAVPASEAQLDDLLGSPIDGRLDRAEFERLVRLARGFRGRELEEALELDWRIRGPRHFLIQRLAPFVAELGRAWADGRIEIRHEHHATAHITDLLIALTRSLPAPGPGPVLALSTLPGESHELGLRMVALLARARRVDVRHLGTESPVPEMLAAVRETGAAALGISVSLATGGPANDRVLAELRADLPDEVRLIVGGAGARRARRGPARVEYASDLNALTAWLNDFVERHGQAAQQEGLG